MARKAGQKVAGAPVKISVPLSADTHARLRYLVTLRQTTATELVAGLVDAAVARVRAASISGESSTETAA